jgi:hypothetical protein
MSRILAVILTSFFLMGVARAADNQLLVVGSLDFDVKSGGVAAGSGSNGVDFSTLVTTMDPSVTVAYGDFYSTLSVEETLGSRPSSFFDGYYPQTLFLSREGYDLTFGYRLMKSVLAFCGWQNNSLLALVVGTQDVGGTTNPQASVMNANFNSDGPYIGTSWSHSFGKKGTLALTLAYAQLATVDSETRIVANDPNSPYSFYATSTTRGFSYGATWTGDLTGSLAYRVGVKGIRYQGDPTSINTNGVIDQYTAVFFGISNYF